MTTQKNRTDLILTLVFLAMILTPCLGTFFGWDFHPAQDENRKLAERPEWGKVSLAKYPEKMDAWFYDHFGFRNTFIRYYNRTLRKSLNIQTPQVLFGEDDWLFYNDPGIMQDFLGEQPLSDKNLLAWKDKLIRTRNNLAEQGIAYRFVIIPNKCNVYTEKMPKALQQAEADIKRIEQLQRFLTDAAVHQPLYLQNALQSAAKDNLVYFPNDTHWTEAGCYIGYCEIINSIQSDVPDIAPIALEKFPRKRSLHHGDLSGKLLGLGKENAVPRNQILALNDRIETSIEWIPDWENGENLPSVYAIRSHNPDKKHSIVIFYDSFGNYGLMPLIQASFREAVFIQNRPNELTLKAVVERFHPDIVIEERKESFLQTPDE